MGRAWMFEVVFPPFLTIILRYVPLFSYVVEFLRIQPILKTFRITEWQKIIILTKSKQKNVIYS